MYGFKGEFSVIRANWCYFPNEIKKMEKKGTLLKSIFFQIYSRMMQHFIWEFKAIKLKE